ncbi:uncharacterized protein GJ701_000846 [Geothlypis trichas]
MCLLFLDKGLLPPPAQFSPLLSVLPSICSEFSPRERCLAVAAAVAAPQREGSSSAAPSAPRLEPLRAGRGAGGERAVSRHALFMRHAPLDHGPKENNNIKPYLTPFKNYCFLIKVDSLSFLTEMRLTPPKPVALQRFTSSISGDRPKRGSRLFRPFEASSVLGRGAS